MFLLSACQLNPKVKTQPVPQPSAITQSKSEGITITPYDVEEIQRRSLSLP